MSGVYLPALDPYAVGRVGEQAGVDPHVLHHVGGPVLSEATDADTSDTHVPCVALLVPVSEIRSWNRSWKSW